MTILTRKIEEGYAGFSRSEKQLATYFLNNLHALPFDTVVAIARSVGVSEMTVIRFIRSLGYDNLKDLKKELRTSYRDLDDVLARHKIHEAYSQTLKERLDLEIRSLLDAYAQTTSDKWKEITHLLASTNDIYIAGFQTSKGLALDLSTRLQYVRRGVQFVENTSGIFLDVLGEPADQTCVVLIDTVIYSRDCIRLARTACKMGFPLIIVMDRFNHWPYQYTSHVLQVSAHVTTFRDSTVGVAALSNLLVNSVAAAIGKRAEQRYRRVNKLNDVFTSFQEDPVAIRGLIHAH